MSLQMLELHGILERGMKQRASLTAVLAADGDNSESRQLEKDVVDAADKCRHLIDDMLGYWSLPMQGEPPF